MTTPRERRALAQVRREILPELRRMPIRELRAFVRDMLQFVHRLRQLPNTPAWRTWQEQANFMADLAQDTIRQRRAQRRRRTP